MMPGMLDEVTKRIYEKDTSRIPDPNHLKMALRYCGRVLFAKFRDYQITFD